MQPNQNPRSPSTPERFAWLSQAAATVAGLHLVAGPGYAMMDPTPRAYATVRQLRNGDVPGHLLSATALARVRHGHRVRYPLILRDSAAQFGAGLWQFPAGRCAPGELPSVTASRELGEEIEVRDAQGAVVTFVPLVRDKTPAVHYLTTDGEEHVDHAHTVMLENTIEAFVPFEAQCSLRGLTGHDREPFGRRVSLFRAEAVLAMAEAGQLTASSCAVARRADELGWFELVA